MIPHPTTYEAAQSLLNMAVDAIERFPPTTRDDVNRTSILITRLDTTTSRAARAVQLGEER